MAKASVLESLEKHIYINEAVIAERRTALSKNTMKSIFNTYTRPYKHAPSGPTSVRYMCTPSFCKSVGNYYD